MDQISPKSLVKTSRPVIWTLKKGMDRRFRAGHPWVYSNELLQSPKGIHPGASVELRDASGRFLAHGFGNPFSLIAFRALSRAEKEDPSSQSWIFDRLCQASEMRKQLGWSKSSHRLCYGEAVNTS